MSRSRLNNRATMEADILSVTGILSPEAASVAPCCPACRTTLVATRFRVAVICPIIQVPHCIRVFFHFV